MRRTTTEWACRAMVLACVLTATPAWSQATDEPVMSLHGGLSFGAVGVSFEEAEASWHSSYRLELGVRVPAWKSGPLRALRLTPKIGLHATHVEGMNPVSDSYAYASVDVALRTTLAKWRVRPYLEGRRGSQSAERVDAARQILNFNGAGTGFGAGIEIPISKKGRGLEIGVTMVTGRFDTFEFKNVDSPADMRHKAIAIHVGWSGQFTGISLPWQ